MLYQLTHIARDKGARTQDDRLDALGVGVARSAAGMAAEVDEAVRRARDRVRYQGLRRFARHALGHEPQVPVWAGRPR